MKILVIVLVLVGLFPLCAFSDMGAIVPGETVNLEEPAQRAIIAHDGFKEILILSTDFKTTLSTKALRFIPFPVKVNISPGTNDIFPNLNKLIKKHDLKYLVYYRNGPPQGKEGVKIISYAELGAHRITQVRVTNFTTFEKWVNEFFKNMGLPERKLTKKEQDIIIYYLKKGFNYFVFDVVDLEKGVNAISPLIYSFDLKKFYYPLVTSSVFSGIGKIELILFSDRGEILNKFFRHTGFTRWMRSTTAHVKGEEMKAVTPVLSDLLGENAVMGVFKHYGPYNFSDDIYFDIPIYEAKPFLPHIKKTDKR